MIATGHIKWYFRENTERKYHIKKIFLVKAIHTAQEIETEILLITFTRVILAYVTTVRDFLLQNLQALSELQNHQTPMVKLGLANLYNNLGEF